MDDPAEEPRARIDPDRREPGALRAGAAVEGGAPVDPPGEDRGAHAPRAQRERAPHRGQPRDAELEAPVGHQLEGGREAGGEGRERPQNPDDVERCAEPDAGDGASRGGAGTGTAGSATGGDEEGGEAGGGGGGSVRRAWSSVLSIATAIASPIAARASSQGTSSVVKRRSPTT